MFHIRRRVKEIENVEIMPGIEVDKNSISWFVSKMFNPEENLWVWIRRIANILTFPILILVIIELFV